MDRATALKMDSMVVKFLAQYGHFPAIVKEREKQIEDLEKRLARKLNRMQVGLEAEFIRQLRQRGRIGNSTEQRGLIEQIIQTPLNQMAEVMADEGVEGAEIGRQLTLEEIANQGVEVAFETFNDNLKENLRNKLYTFSKDTADRIVGDFAETLSNAQQEGVGIDEVSRRLRDDFSDLRDHRLKLIARTEIQGGQNEGINETMLEQGVKFKQWITVGDNRVRGNSPQDEFDHVTLHGQVVKQDEPFSNGLMFPTDRSGYMGDWINCRCRMRPYIPRREENIISTPYYPAA